MSDQRPDEIKTRLPCRICDGDMGGEHHKALSHKACREATKKDTAPKVTTIDFHTDKPSIVTTVEEVDFTAPEAEPVAEAPDIVKVVPDLETIEENPDLRHSYWMGTTHDSPFQNVHAGGRSFPRATGQMTDEDGSGQPKFSGPRGQEAMLSAKEVKAITAAVAKKVVQWVGTGKNRRAIKINLDTLGYRQAPTDEPMGKYLFMHRTDSLGFKDKEGQPEPMVS